MAVRGWVVATCPNPSNPTRHRKRTHASHLTRVYAFAFNSPTSTTGLPFVKDVAEAELFGTMRVSMKFPLNVRSGPRDE